MAFAICWQYLQNKRCSKTQTKREQYANTYAQHTRRTWQNARCEAVAEQVVRAEAGDVAGALQAGLASLTLSTGLEVQPDFVRGFASTEERIKGAATWTDRCVH